MVYAHDAHCDVNGTGTRCTCGFAPAAVTTTTALLTERGQTHGSFASNAFYAQRLRELYRSSPHWEAMPDEHKEALDDIALKFSRILSGQSTFRDHWTDVQGYAKLAEDVCPK